MLSIKPIHIKIEMDKSKKNRPRCFPVMEIDEGIEFDIDEEIDSAEVTAAFKDNNVEHKYLFHLLHSEGRWYIDKINNVIN